MKPHINMIGILTNQFDAMRDFYHDIMWFEILMEMDGKYVEFVSEGVRFAISTGEVMEAATWDTSYLEEKKWHSFELAFEADSPQGVDEDFHNLISKWATPRKEPANMPWWQRTAFFADPDGNVHEIFSNL